MWCGDADVRSLYIFMYNVVVILFFFGMIWNGAALVGEMIPWGQSVLTDWFN